MIDEVADEPGFIGVGQGELRGHELSQVLATQPLQIEPQRLGLPYERGELA